MAAGKLDFGFNSRGIVDPYSSLMEAMGSRGAMAQALTAQDNAAERDRKALLEAREMGLKEETAKRQRTEWEQTQEDRTADRKFLASLAKAPEHTYRSIADLVASSPEAKADLDALAIPESIMTKMKEAGWDESTKTIKPEHYSLLNDEEYAQMAAIEEKQALLGQDLVEKAKVSLSKADQIEAILKNSKNITPTMYTALEAAKKEEKAKAEAAAALVAEERKGLETYLKDLRKDTANDLVVNRGTYTLESSTGYGSSGSGTSGGKPKAANGWAADKTVQDQLNELSPLGEGPDTEKGERLAQIAMTKGLSANEFKDILASATTEGASGYRTFRGNTFINPETSEEDAGMYIANKIDELAAKKEASGYGGSSKTSNKTVGFYNKNDPSAALSYRASEIANTEARINALRGISTRPQTRAEKEAAADEAILARLAQGLGRTTPIAAATPVETVKKSVQEPKPRTNQDSTSGGVVSGESKKKPAEEVKKEEVGLKKQKINTKAEESVKDIMPEPRVDYTGRPFDLLYDKTIDAGVGLGNLWDAYKSNIAKPIERRLNSALGNDYVTYIDEDGIEVKKYVGNLPESEIAKYRQTAKNRQIPTPAADLRDPIDKVSVEDLKKLSSDALVQILQREDLSVNTRRKVAAVLQGPRGAPGMTSGPSSVVFDILQSPMSRAEKMSALRSAGVPTAQIQELLSK